MNRLHHLKKTLPENIRQNKKYSDLQHILLDYNSTDGMEKWVQENLQDHINNGRVIYYKTGESESFHRSHSRNMAFRLAEESIVCNIDADNYTGEDFAFYLNEHFIVHRDGYLAVDYNADDKRFKDSYGRIACFKKDFLAVGGYDERMSGYGYEDIDFCERLSRYGLKQYHITSDLYLRSISHSHQERQANEPRANQIQIIYIQFINPFKSHVIYLFNDQTFSMATLLDSQEGFGIPSLEEKGWINGLWKTTDEQLVLKPDNQRTKSLNITSERHLLYARKNTFYRITDDGFQKELKRIYPILTNHQHYLNNIKRNVIKVNSEKFGCGTVFRNFKEKIRIN